MNNYMDNASGYGSVILDLPEGYEFKTDEIRICNTIYQFTPWGLVHKKRLDIIDFQYCSENHNLVPKTTS